jgi:hypothetical protein
VSQADEDQPLPAAEEAELLALLEAALRPTELDTAVNERLIELALEDPLAPPSVEELAESERLRQALEHGTPHEDAALLAALRSAAAPGEDEAAVERVLRTLDAGGPGVEGPPGRARSNVVYAVFGAASAVLAAAAVLVLFVSTAQNSAAPAQAAVEYRKPRTTAPLFNDRFATRDTTARMDLIASARQRDLRDNRYASWGVK